MDMQVKHQLLEILQDLREKELKSFQWYLQDPGLLEGFPPVRIKDPETANRMEVVDLMVQQYPLDDAVRVTNLIMKKIKKDKSQAPTECVDLSKEHQPMNLRVTSITSEVSMKHRYSDYIPAPSNCELILDHKYTLLCPIANKIQPTEEKFHLDVGPNLHPTFEVHLPTETEEVSITVRDQMTTDVWRRDIDLTDIVQRTDNWPNRLPPDKRLLSVRTQFVEKVSGSTLNQLLDSLLQRGVMNEGEMDSARIKPKADRARDVIDVVRNRGAEASNSLINDLRELEPYLSETLHLSFSHSPRR